MRESSGRTLSSKRPEPACSSSTTRAWKRRPFLSTSTMSPAPIPLDVVRGGGAGGAGTSIRLSCISRTPGATAGGRRPRLPDLPVQTHVLGTVRTHLEDRAAAGGERAVERGAQGLRIAHAPTAAAVERRRVGEVEAVRRGDVTLEVLALALDREEVED